MNRFCCSPEQPSPRSTFRSIEAAVFALRCRTRVQMLYDSRQGHRGREQRVHSRQAPSRAPAELMLAPPSRRRAFVSRASFTAEDDFLRTDGPTPLTVKRYPTGLCAAARGRTFITWISGKPA